MLALSLSLFFLLLSSTNALTTDLFISPLSSSSPTSLARISYDPSTLKSSLLSYTPPQNTNTNIDNDDSLIRIGILGSGSGSGSGITEDVDTTSLWTASLTDSAALIPSPDRAPLLKLFIGMDGGVYHVSVSGGSSSSLDGSDGKNATESATGPVAQADGILNPIVEIVKSEPGPRPLLNRPVVLGPDGKNVDEPVEKTFIQKYWWVLLLITFFAMSGSAEGQ